MQKARPKSPARILKASLGKLSPREIEALCLTAQGRTCPVIAARLGLSQETIRSHIKNACRKLKAVNKINAISLALALGILSPVWVIAPERENVVKYKSQTRRSDSAANKTISEFVASSTNARSKR